MTIPEPQHEHSSVCFRIAGTIALAVAMLWGHLITAQGPPLPERVKRIYVPVEDFQAILHRDKEGVLLPKQEFEALWKQAVDNQIDSSPGPNGLVVSSARYETVIEDRQLLITASIEFHQYLAGWRSFPLLFRNLGVESASLSDQPARLGRDNQGNLRLFHNQTGRHVLELKLSTPLGAVGSDQVAAFTILSGPPSELSVDVPAQKHLLFQELSLERPAPIDQPTTYRLPVGGAANIRLRMTQKQEEKLTDSLVFANTLIGVDAAPGEITWQSMTQLQVFGAKFNQLVLNVPVTLEVADVQSSGLEAWELAEDPEDQEWTRITLNYRQPISGSRTVRLRGVMSNRDGYGARVALLRDGVAAAWRRVHSDGSYLSASESSVRFGLGGEEGPQAVGVLWPSGLRERFDGLGVDQKLFLEEGAGTPWPE